MFPVAGLGDHGHALDSASLAARTIRTTPPNALVPHVRDRMPVILPHDPSIVWLAPTLRNVEPVPARLPSCPISAMIANPVSPWATNSARDAPECMAPLN